MKPLFHPCFVKFIVYFNKNQDFFECHEVLEEYWNTIPDRTKSHPLTSYILLSTGLYHWRRGNIPGALRTLKKADMRMKTLPEKFSQYTEGIDFPALRQNIKNSIAYLEKKQSFIAFPIKITSPKLQELIVNTEPLLQLLPLNSEAVINKHILRDRSEILQLRDEKKAQNARLRSTKINSS